MVAELLGADDLLLERLEEHLRGATGNLVPVDAGEDRLLEFPDDLFLRLFDYADLLAQLRTDGRNSFCMQSLQQFPPNTNREYVCVNERVSLRREFRVQCVV